MMACGSACVHVTRSGHLATFSCFSDVVEKKREEKGKKTKGCIYSVIAGIMLLAGD